MTHTPSARRYARLPTPTTTARKNGFLVMCGEMSQNLVSQARKVLGAFFDFGIAQLYLDSGPGTFVFDYRIDLEPFVVSIVKQAVAGANIRRQINSEITQHEVLEQHAERLHVAKQPLGSSSQKSGSKRRIGKRALGPYPYTSLRSQRGLPPLQILDKVKSGEQIKVRRDGVLIDIPLPKGHVRQQGLVRDGLASPFGVLRHSHSVFYTICRVSQDWITIVTNLTDREYFRYTSVNHTYREEMGRQ